jgi:hypothetical protein
MRSDSRLETILQHATTDELRVIAAIAERANAEPAILVTVGGRRYVVAEEDELTFHNIPDGKYDYDPRNYGAGILDKVFFGAQWMRKYGKVDEMYRSLSGYEVTKVARVPRSRVWGK